MTGSLVHLSRDKTILGLFRFSTIDVVLEICNWASKVSPTLGCSIEISRDICMSVGRSAVCLRETHTNKTLGRAQDPRSNGAWLNKLTE